MPLDLDAALEGDAGGDKPEESTDGITSSKPAPEPEPEKQDEETKGISAHKVAQTSFPVQLF